MALNPAEQRALIKNEVESDLAFLWEDSGIELGEQVKLAQAGYKKLRTFVGLADTKPEVRIALAAPPFDLDPAVQGALPRIRLQIACILSAWDGASQMASRESSLRVEAKSLGVTKPVSMPERKAMKRVFEDAHGKIPASEQPSALYLSQKMEEIETDEPSASALDEISSLDDICHSATSSGLDPVGRVLITTKKVRGSLPSNPEQFRMRLRVEANTWCYLAGKFTSKQYLRDLTPALFQKYTDYFLGPKCNSMEVPDSLGRMTPLHPPWQVVLSYELACRKAAFEAVRDEDEQLSLALLRVIRDAELKEIHFTSPIALMGKTSKPSAPGAPPGAPPGLTKRQKRAAAEALRNKAAAAGRGKGTPKGKGKGREQEGDLETKTPDGRELCFKYSTPKGCSKGSACARVHACRIRGCTEAHPTHLHGQ